MGIADRLNMRASVEDFQNCIERLELKIQALDNVIRNYQTAKDNADQFLESDDSNYEAICRRIDVNVKAAGKAKASLLEAKAELQSTIDKMENMSGKVLDTLEDATEAVGSTIDAAFKIDAIL